MAGPFQTLRKFWLAATGHEKPAVPEVIVHDPDAQKAHDLDDPFLDDQVKARMASLIAATGNRKTKNSF